MKDFPTTPTAADAPAEMFERGHLWLLELVDGAGLRFRLGDGGVLRFGDETRVYDGPDDVPAPYQHAVRHVRENLDRESLRNAVADPKSVVFFGWSTQRRSTEYDWERIPSFLGVDVWSASADGFRPPDTAEKIFERLGLRPVNAVERERNTRDFDPESYVVPRSAWYDGPAKGVLIRNKRGGRARLLHAEFRERDPNPVNVSAEEFAQECATQQRFERVADRIEAMGWTVTADVLYDRVYEDVMREEHRRLAHRESDVDVAAFRSEIAALTRAFVSSRER
ncbi:hypothetical protein NDI76_15345 [Halogeometricum sp. S1BR25-6]|uniref:RNA ligase domain-containing protein n=1 Tax=Halogeometricum salsisoli TaxID=2950536 RepID=A0ABU2GH37_9EURY|nr:hypothetical protein [Halogeometricum sp. S1BR25-6]MDS0300120.1 hypothetical protein [Halogeometricum sp. S1BR25-6]